MCPSIAGHHAWTTEDIQPRFAACQPAQKSHCPVYCILTRCPLWLNCDLASALWLLAGLSLFCIPACPKIAWATITVLLLNLIHSLNLVTTTRTSLIRMSAILTPPSYKSSFWPIVSCIIVHMHYVQSSCWLMHADVHALRFTYMNNGDLSYGYFSLTNTLWSQSAQVRED